MSLVKEVEEYRHHCYATEQFQVVELLDNVLKRLKVSELAKAISTQQKETIEAREDCKRVLERLGQVSNECKLAENYANTVSQLETGNLLSELWPVYFKERL